MWSNRAHSLPLDKSQNCIFSLYDALGISRSEMKELSLWDTLHGVLAAAKKTGLILKYNSPFLLLLLTHKREDFESG